MLSNNEPDNYYQQSLGYHLKARCSMRSNSIDYATALRTFQSYKSAIVPLNRRTYRCNRDVKKSPTASALANFSVYNIKLKILSLCCLAVTCKQKNSIDTALKRLEIALQLSETLADQKYDDGQFYTAVILSIMGKLYLTKQYYLFALASFQAALDAYRSFTHGATVNVSIQGRIAAVLCDIAHIAQITNYPDVAVEHYLEALWHFNQLGNEAKMRQITQQLNQLLDLEKCILP